MNSLDKVIRFGLGSAVIGLAVVAAPAAEAFEITTATRGTYDVDIVFGSWDSKPELSDVLKTPWWGDEELAEEVEAALFSDWTNFEASLGWNCEGDCVVVAGYELDDSDGDRLILGRRTNGSDINGMDYIFTDSNENSYLDGGREMSGGQYWLTGQMTAVPVPTPAAVLPGLFGMSLSAIRKRRVASSEEA